jgi:hypothetical protein
LPGFEGVAISPRQGSLGEASLPALLRLRYSGTQSNKKRFDTLS